MVHFGCYCQAHYWYFYIWFAYLRRNQEILPKVSLVQIRYYRFNIWKWPHIFLFIPLYPRHILNQKTFYKIYSVWFSLQDGHSTTCDFDSISTNNAKFISCLPICSPTGCLKNKRPFMSLAPFWERVIFSGTNGIILSKF